MKNEVEDRRRRKAALQLLAVHRQAKPDTETAAAYLVAVQDLPPDVLEHACKDLGYAQRGEYENAWPELGTIRNRCEVIMRHRRELEESRRLKLNDPDGDPVDPAKWGEFKAKVDQLLAKKVLP